MLIESPDKLIVNGRKLSWIDGTTFFAFKTLQGKIHIAITSGSGTEFLLQINQVDLTDYVKKNLPELAVYLDHESLANVLHQLKPEMIKEKMNRGEFEFSGRLWNGNGKNYISFWNNKKSVDKSLLDKFMGYAKVTYENTVFEFPNNQGDYKPYDKIDEPKIPSQKSAEDKFMSQIHTLPPGAKKWAMRGMSMREALFRESPDAIFPDEGDPSVEITFESNEVTSVFCVFKDSHTNKNVLIVAFIKDGYVTRITTGDKKLDDELNVKKIVAKNQNFAMIHSNLLYHIRDRIEPHIEGQDEKRDEALLSGRSFLFEGMNYVSVWVDSNSLIKMRREIDKLLGWLNIQKDRVLFETVDFNGEYKSYTEVFGGGRKESKLSPEQIKDLMKKQHLDPRAKKILRTLASSNKHLDSLTRAANGMNISVAQLKNMMTAGD
jgi:hypothetical protein